MKNPGGILFILVSLSVGLLCFLLFSCSDDDDQIEFVPETFFTTLGSDLYDHGMSAQQTSDGGYIICGTRNLKPYVMKIDHKGTLLWDKSYEFGNSASAYSVELAYDTGFVLTGHYKIRSATPLI